MSNIKGLLLAGGLGKRLYPLTEIINKQLLPVYDKPMIYYSLATLISMGINDIALITQPEFIPMYSKLFKNIDQLNIKLSLIIQPEPKGIAQSFLVAQNFIQNDPCCLILGDNIFHGSIEILDYNVSTIFAYKVNNPKDYGVIEFKDKKVISIEEKPSIPKSNYVVPGLYYYSSDVVEYAESLQFSKRGELEITDLNKIYLEKNKLNVGILKQGTAWLDAGTPDSLLQSSEYIKTIQERQGILIGSIELEAFNSGFIDKKELNKYINNMPSGTYKRKLENFIYENISD